MGIFSSKKKTKVDTATVRMIEDNMLPETIKTSMLKGLLRDENITDHTLDGLLSGPANRIERMYRYAKDHYYYGLPESDFVSSTDGEGVVRQLLEEQVGWPVTIEYFNVGSLNSTHMAWQTLLEQYDYDLATNEIGSLSQSLGVPVYLTEFRPIITTQTLADIDPGAMNPWGDPDTAGYTPDRPAQANRNLGLYRKASTYIVDESAEHESIEIHYQYTLDGVSHTGEIEVSLASFDMEDDFYQAKYTYKEILVEADPGKGILEESITHTKFWTYQDGAGLYPEVDLINDLDYKGLGTYFPFAFFRHDRRNRASNSLKDTEAYKTTEKLLSYLDIDFKDMSDEIHANPDIGDVEQAAMVFAVPAVTENEAERHYLFDYFNALYYASTTAVQSVTGPGLFGELIGKALNNSGIVKGSAIKISDADFRMTLTFGGIAKRRVAGVIGKVGEHDSGEDKGSFTEKIMKRGHRSDAEYEVEVTRKVPYLYYRRQINESFYEEVMVSNPRLSYRIWRGYNTVGGIGSSDLIIPLDHAITGTYSLALREQLYPRSLHFVFNTRVTTKVKWYQRGAFKVVLVIAAIVLMIVYPPAGMQALAVALSVGAIAAAAWIILVMVVKSLAIRYAFKLFVKEVGADAAMIAAIIATAFGVTGVMQNAYWAPVMLQLVTGLTGGIQTENKRLMSKYDKDRNEFNLFMEEANKELDEALNLLKTSNLIDPFEFIGQEPLIVYGENPQDFYQRTIHSGNIGVVGIEAVHHYVDISLELPDMSNMRNQYLA